MGVRVLADEGRTAIFCSVSEVAFGPTFDTPKDARDFLEWAEANVREDLRTLSDRALASAHAVWHSGVQDRSLESEWAAVRHKQRRNAVLTPTKEHQDRPLAIPLGEDRVDQVTGFKGKVIGVTRWLTGCDQYGLQPPVGEDGKIPDVKWFDEQRLGATAVANGGSEDDCPQPKARD